MDFTSPWLKDNGPITLTIKFYDHTLDKELSFPIEGQSLVITYSAHGETKRVFYMSQETIQAFNKDVTSKGCFEVQTVGILGVVMPVAYKAGFDGLGECLFCKKGEHMKMCNAEIALPLTSRWRDKNRSLSYNHPFLMGLAHYSLGWVDDDTQILYVYLRDKDSFNKLSGVFWDAGYLKWWEGTYGPCCVEEFNERRKRYYS